MINLKNKKGSVFIKIIATIGAVLIFVGIAWLIAKNWHQIPDALKIIILVFSTFAAFTAGVFVRRQEHEGVGRALITLGALLYISSLFLISQIYNLVSSMQSYAWLLFFAWVLIFITAYLLKSPENLVLSMIVFFPWLIIQYLSSVSEANLSSEGGIIFSFILIFLSIGVLLYGLSTFHNSIKHKFTNIYRFWVVFYFLIIFYILSFQSILPILSEYSFEGGAFTIFLVLFIVTCFLGFILGTLLAVSKKSIAFKEILGFIGIVVVLFFLILATKAGVGLVGTCSAKNCYDFDTKAECNSAPDLLTCEWEILEGREDGSCRQISCYNFKTEPECNSALSTLECNWQNNHCIQEIREVNTYETCRKYNNQKDECLDQDICKWRTSSGFLRSSKSLPTSLWLLWIVNNFVFIGFIILVIWYGQYVGSTKIINLGLIAFIIEIISRYIGFWMDFKGYFAFSVLAILGGILLIFGAWAIPKWRKNLLKGAKGHASVKEIGHSVTQPIEGLMK